MEKLLESIKMTKTNKSYLLIGSLLVFVGAVLYSSKAVLVKLAYQYDVDSISLLTLRMLFSLPFYFIILIWRQTGPDKTQKQTPKEWLSVILLGMSGYYVASLLDFLGLQYVSAGLERLILFVYPTMVVLMLAIFYKKKMTRTIWMALVLTYIGISIAFMDKVTYQQSADLYKGAVMIFVAAFAYAVYVVGSGQLVARFGTLRFTSIGMIAAGLMIIIQHGFTDQWALGHFHPQVYFLSLLMAVFATVVPSFLIMEGIKRIGSGNASIISSIGPISTIILAYIFLDERLGIMQIIGTFVVISGVLIISLNKDKAQ